ncbi:MAG: S-layer homology domain-containing protein [Solibacillus sp.]
MDSKRTQKLSKAAVATVLAASGIVVGLPQPVNAYMFSDLNPNADYYQPIVELYNRNIIGREGDTFRPNDAITRGDAAKMLALALGLNTSTTNVFDDVDAQKTVNYGYINALENAGIINGFQDGTFRPNERITRGQMAKILTLGFKFGVSSSLKNQFQDVSEQNGNAYYIQTLLDLKVTKGRTAVTFEPASHVTRGQMATFIWRAINADAGKPVYTIGDIANNKVYINGVAYAVSSELRAIFNSSNRSILKGAEIEGKFSGMTLMSLSKLVINATGTKTGLLTLDADESTFDGQLVINGSYVRFKNWKLTGETVIAEKQRRSLAQYIEANPLKNMRIASLNGVGFIDWDKQTEPTEPSYLNPGGSQQLIDVPDEDDKGKRKKYELRMPKIEKYVDFESTTIENLYIEHNNAYVSADRDVERLTIARDVYNVELYADAAAMYIDTDVNLTMYGEHDAEFVYKNSYKSVSFWTDSFYDFLYVTNGSGWIDLGEFAYIDEVILPPKKSPNDIFDDYENDNGNIGWIEDEEGNEVDRDPVENGVIPDDRAPEITQLSVVAGGTSATVTLTADEDGTYFYMVLPADERPPSISEIKTNARPPYGNGIMLMDEPVTFTVNNLEEETDYVIYIIAIDDEENVSDRSEEGFLTKDGSPPSISINGMEGVYGGKRVQFNLNVNEGGTYYYYIRKDTSAVAPTVADIMNTHTGTATVDRSGNYTIVSNIYETNLPIEPNTQYQIFAVMEDKSGNISGVTMAPVTSTELDDENPYVINPNLEYDSAASNRDKNYFYMYFSEELIKETAEDINNYVLSGTGIVNVTGQTTIKPSEVVYSKEAKGSKVRLTIPSLTGFVNGDTLRATVLPTVLDRADNPFETIENPGKNNVVDNYADYIHSDVDKPLLSILSVNTNNEQTKAEVTFNASKAGTYYYMIMPSDVDLADIKPRDFVDEYNSETKTGKFQVNGQDIYVGAPDQGPAYLGDQKIDVNIPQNLNQFTSYSLYMVLKDRSGGLSEIKRTHIKDDSKPPLVSELKISAGEGNISDDSAANIRVATDEGGLLHYWAVPKYQYDAATGSYVTNPTLANLVVPNSESTLLQFEQFAHLVKSNGRSSSITGGINDIHVSGLTAHREYVMYVAVEDTYGNITARLMGDPGGATINDAEPNGDIMELEYYSDVKVPQVGDVIKRNIEGTEFTITFSEAIMRQPINNTSLIPATGAFDLSTILTITNDAGADVTNKYEFVSYTVATEGAQPDTAKETQLVIKPVNAADADATFTVHMKDTAYDFKAQNTFAIEDFGKYVYPPAANRVNTMTVAIVQAPYVLDVPSETSSKRLALSVNFGADLQYNQTYYYAVTNPSNAARPSAQSIMSAVATNIAPIGSPIVLFGKAQLSASTQLSQVLTLVTGTVNQTDVFKTGQKVYLFTLDEYGNIVWATDNSTTPNDFIKVTKQ